jgi:hypothetical protein
MPDGRHIHSGVDIYLRADGTPWASYSSPDRAAYDIPVSHIDESGPNSVELTLPFATLTLTWHNDLLRGQWRSYWDRTVSLAPGGMSQR